MDAPLMLAMTALAALATVLIFRVPELGLVLCVVTGPFLKGIVQQYLGSVDITLLLFGVTFFAIFIRSLAERSLALPEVGMNVLVGLLLSLLLGSLLHDPMPAVGFAVFAKFAFLTLSIMYMTVMWCTSLERIERLLFLFVGITLAYAAVTFALIFFVDRGLSGPWRANLADTPALAVGMLVACGILAATVARDRVHSRSTRFLVDVLTLVSVVELIVLNSRGPLIALIGGGACLFLLSSGVGRRQALRAGLVVAVIIVLAFALAPSQYTQRYALLADLASGTAGARVDMWRLVAEHGADWFLSGAGITGFAASLMGEAGITASAVESPHNIFLGVYATAGFFALSAFVWLIGLLVHKGIRSCRAVDLPHQSLALAVVVCAIAFLVWAQFGGALLSTRPLWLFAGLVLSLDRLLARARKVTR